MMQMKEQRSMADLDYQAGKESQAMANQASANAAQAQAWGSAISGAVGSVTTLGAANIATSTEKQQINMWGNPV